MTSDEIRVVLDTLGRLLIEIDDPKIDILHELEEAVKSYLYLPQEQDLADKIVSEVYQSLPLWMRTRSGLAGMGTFASILKQTYSQAKINNMLYQSNSMFSHLRKK
jgi:hypothetical protein